MKITQSHSAGAVFNRLLLSFFFCLLFQQLTAFTIHGKTDENLNSQIDKTYATVVWSFGEKAYAADSVATIVKGNFELFLKDKPPAMATLFSDSAEFSIGIVLLFVDRDDNKQFDWKKDSICGVCENYGFAYTAGDFQNFLNKTEKRKQEEMNDSNYHIVTLRQLKPGVRLCKIIKPTEQNKSGYFDDFIPVESTSIFVKRGTRKELRFPNWT